MATARHDLMHACLGLVSESGEFSDALKKEHAYGRPLDVTNLREELGDILWYVALGCRALNVTMEEVAQVNIAKLRVRYPDSFTNEKAINRNVGAERQVLEASKE